MKHPNREEWLPYLAGEAPASVRRQLDEHLHACEECATEVAAWHRAEQRLECWELPKLERCPEESISIFQPLMKWGVAAALVLAVGFGLGRVASRGEGRPLSAESRQQLRQELSADFQAALAQAQSQSSNSLAALELRLASSARSDARQLLQAVSEVLSRGREEDRRAVLALFNELEQQHTTAYIALRRDLETVASFTDDNVRAARLKLVQLVAETQPSEGSETTTTP